MKILCKNSCVFENKHFSFSFFHFIFHFHLSHQTPLVMKILTCYEKLVMKTLYKTPVCLKINIFHFHTCISFLTTSRPRMWSKADTRNGSLLMLSFSLSRCQMRTRESSIAVAETCAKDTLLISKLKNNS